MSTAAETSVRVAHRSVLATFFLNGLTMATWASRIPAIRADLDLGPGSLGLLLLSASGGAVLSIPSTGALVQRFGSRRVVVVASLVAATGMVLVALGSSVVVSLALTALGLFLLGVGNGAWDVAMNVEGAAVERRLGRSVMPRLHAAFSLGTVAGASVGALLGFAGVGVGPHLLVGAVVVASLGRLTVQGFLAVVPREPGTPSHALAAWREPRTLVLGLMVLSLALTEGVANDWLGVGIVDGYDTEVWVGSAAFAAFVTAMTLGRIFGGTLLDRFGRPVTLWATMVTAGIGVVMVVFGQVLVVVAAGILLWGLGASLGFPVGMSAAADDPGRAAARVSVVSTVGYVAFLGGPPLLGFLGSHLGILHALLVVSVLLVPSALAVPAAREPAASR